MNVHISVRAQEEAEITPTMVKQGKTLFNKPATRAIDKDLSTFSTTDTGDGAGWLKLEFDKTYFIHKVLIHYKFYTNSYLPNQWCVQNEANFRSCVNDQNNVDVSVYQGEVKQKSCGTLELTYGLKQSDQIYTMLCNTDGNEVKLSKTKGKIAVQEVVVTGKGTVVNRNKKIN